MTAQITKYETGATSHAVNDLILFSDNTRQLAQLRDKIYMAHYNLKDGHRQKTTSYLQSRFLNLFFGAKKAYLKEFAEYGNIHILNISLAQIDEFTRLYASEFENWKIDNALK